MIESKIKARYEGKGEVKISETEHPEIEARLAFSMAEKWGMIMGSNDGEDSSGRHKLKIMSCEDVNKRAWEMSGLLMKTARDKGLLHKSPGFRDLEEFNAANKNDDFVSRDS